VLRVAAVVSCASPSERVVHSVGGGGSRGRAIEEGVGHLLPRHDSCSMLLLQLAPRTGGARSQ